MNVKLEKDERIDDLEYRNLKIIQKKDGFCFGIDSVLLSDFAKNIKKDSKVMDIGTGTGIIAILLSAKSKAKKIYGVEIQEEMAKMADKSVKLNNLEEKIKIINADINNASELLEKNTFDAIVTNPPYKKNNSGIINENEMKLISRHEIKCNIEDIIRESSKFLKDKGELYMVHRPERLAEIIVTLKKFNLEPKVLRFVQSNQEKNPSMFLLKAIKNAGEFLKVEKTLIIYDTEGKYTQEILKIYNKI